MPTFLYEIIDGKRVNAALVPDFQRMNNDFHARFGYWLIVSDGVRSYLEQKKLYLDYINGISNVRAANPDSDQAYHCETNPTGPRALDIRDTGPDDGVTRYGNARSAWIRDNARNYNFNPRGYHEFNEPWHIEGLQVLATVEGGWTGGAAGGDPLVRAEQAFLNAARGEQLVVDGDLGPATRAAIERYQTFLNQNGYGQLVVDGDWGPATQAAHALYYAVWADVKLVVDGILGEQTIKELQESLGVEQDGIWGEVTTKALQRATGAFEDGVLGPQTIRALQENVGATVDGSMGQQTVTKLQEFLNLNMPWRKVAVKPEAPVDDFIVTPRVPTLPFAAYGWNVPYGQEKRANGKLTHYIVHHETAFSSQAEYYKKRNERGNCPTWEVDGAIIGEFAHPALKPSTTGAANEYSVASETVNTGGEPDWKVAEESLESHAKIAAWLSQQDFISAPDGTIVDCREFVLDREHVIGHKEAGINATRCPGEYQMEHMDWIVERAQAIVAAGPVEEPETPPTDPPVVVPPASLGEQIAGVYRELGDLLEQLPANL